MEFRILGPLEVVEDGRSIRLDRQRLRALLAFLLLHANEPVSSDRLIDQVWGPDPPKTAGASLQNYISRLRKAIGPELIVSQPPGYLLRVDPERYDLARFERLTAEAREADPRERAEKLRAALALWRGPALDDLSYEPFARDEVGRLEEERLAALEDCIDAELELGRRDSELIGELEELVEHHPLRERFRAQLMRALYRAGRQADALDAFKAARKALTETLGLEPGEELRSLQQAILRHDASLRPTAERAVARAPDRRTVTVLFCDLVGSSQLAAELDPEAYRALLSHYFRLVRATIQRHGGTLEKFIGDAVMAVFGVPDLHEDDALRAVRAAVEAQTVLQDEGIAARVGVCTGEVHVLSEWGEPLHVSGAVTSVAAQLEGRAPAGGVLASEPTYALVRDAVRAKHVNDAWVIEQVLDDAAPYARRLDAPLVGRTVELARLHAAYVDARNEGHARVATVAGEAGIGKTRIMREVLTRIGDDARVLVGRCSSYGDGATYLPIAEIVRQAAGESSTEAIRALLAQEDDAEEVARRVAEVTGSVEGAAPPGEAFWAVRRFLEALARERPLVLVLDDIHWAEPTLLDLVEYLGGWAEEAVFVLCAARRELLESRPAWGGPTSTGFVLELTPLDPDEVGELVVGLSDAPVDPYVARRIVEQAGGNPLFAEQLLALATEAPELALDDMPPTVEALLASRLDRLDPQTLAVLRRASVLGRRFKREELGDLTPAEESQRTGYHLAELSDRAFVHPRQDVFAFHHALVRDVAYRGIPKTDRADLHELAARGLDRRGGAEELVGYHFEQASRFLSEIGRIDDRAHKLAAAAGERLGAAGIRAWKLADVPAAVNLLSRAIDLKRDESLICELGLALNARGERERALELLADLQGPRAPIERAFLRTLAEPNRAGELLEAATAAIPVFERAGDDRSLGRAWYGVAFVRGGFHCEYAATEEAAERIAACYRRAGWSSSAPVDFLGHALTFGPRPVDEAVARLEPFSGEPGDRAADANSALWLAWLESMRGNFDVARVHVERARTLFQDLGLIGGVIDFCGRVTGAIELLADRPDVGERALRDACAFLQERHDTAVLATRAAELAATLYEQGRYDEAAAWVRVATESAGEDDLDAALTRQPVEAKLLAQREETGAAEELARATVELAERTDALNRRAEALLALAEVLASARVDESQEHFQHALALYERKGNLAAARLTVRRLQAAGAAP